MEPVTSIREPSYLGSIRLGSRLAMTRSGPARLEARAHGICRNSRTFSALLWFRVSLVSIPHETAASIDASRKKKCQTLANSAVTRAAYLRKQSALINHVCPAQTDNHYCSSQRWAERVRRANLGQGALAAK